MKLLSVRLIATVGSLGLLSFAVACGSKGSPAAPTPTVFTPVVTPKIVAPAAKTPTGGRILDTLKPSLSVNNAEVTGDVGTVTYEFQVSELDSFPNSSRSIFSKDIEQGGDGSTNWTPPSNLITNFKYFWRARAKAEKLSDPTDWTPVETFRILTKGFFWNGTEMWDPLTDRTTIGARVGGHFVDNVGWQADADSDGIDYSIPTCASCTIEFDVTNFNEAEGGNREKDVKWISMGDGSTFGDFVAFRNHPWKMHLEQRGDGDGTGMKLIWRNGDVGDGEPGDHTWRNDSTVQWHESKVYHFTLTWNPSGFQVWVGETLADGSLVNNKMWVSDGFGGHAYAPPNHRVSLGTRSRTETMSGAIWRNVRVYAGGIRSR